ncbi:MAG: universal stress protein [Bacteroidota bacterium]
MTATKTILVPTDFTEVAWFALQHAIRVSEVVKEPIYILHCVSDLNKIDEAQSKMASLIDLVKNKYAVTPKSIVKVGNYMTDIALTADEINASMVIMGSSTVKEMDENKVSWVLKLITSCRVPFITIQEPPVNKRYDDIVFPVDFTLQNREKHEWISYFSDYYLSRFHIIKPNISDPKLMAQIDINLASAKKFLDERGAKYVEYTVPGIKKYEEEVLEMAVNIRADLIIIMTTPTDKEGKFIVEPEEQYILAHAGHIPVMSINPR